VAATIVYAGLCAKNILDEMYQSSTVRFFVTYFAWWMLVPAINLFAGLRAKTLNTVRTTVVIAGFYLWCMWFYAFNGSTEGKLGAERLHLALTPAVMLLGVPLPVALAYVWNRIDPFRKRNL
jgi:hypothetical protein